MSVVQYNVALIITQETKRDIDKNKDAKFNRLDEARQTLNQATEHAEKEDLSVTLYVTPACTHSTLFTPHSMAECSPVLAARLRKTSGICHTNTLTLPAEKK